MTNNTRPLGPLPNHSTVHLSAPPNLSRQNVIQPIDASHPALSLRVAAPASSEHGVYARLDAQAAQIQQLMGELAALRRYVTRIEQHLQARSRP